MSVKITCDEETSLFAKTLYLVCGHYGKKVDLGDQEKILKRRRK